MEGPAPPVAGGASQPLPIAAAGAEEYVVPATGYSPPSGNVPQFGVVEGYTSLECLPARPGAPPPDIESPPQPASDPLSATASSSPAADGSHPHPLPPSGAAPVPSSPQGYSPQVQRPPQDASPYPHSPSPAHVHQPASAVAPADPYSPYAQHAAAGAPATAQAASYPTTMGVAPSCPSPSSSVAPSTPPAAGYPAHPASHSRPPAEQYAQQHTAPYGGAPQPQSLYQAPYPAAVGQGYAPQQQQYPPPSAAPQQQYPPPGAAGVVPHAQPQQYGQQQQYGLQQQGYGLPGGSPQHVPSPSPGGAPVQGAYPAQGGYPLAAPGYGAHAYGGAGYPQYPQQGGQHGPMHAPPQQYGYAQGAPPPSGAVPQYGQGPPFAQYPQHGPHGQPPQVQATSQPQLVPSPAGCAYTPLPVGSAGVPRDEAPHVQPYGRKKALLIGINYLGHPVKVQLKGCINDVHRLYQFVTTHFHIPRERILVLTDDQQNPALRPTRSNIIQAMKWLAEGAAPGDSLFFHYSGHGGQVKDPTGLEIDGMNETILPTDYKTAGHLIDDDMHDLMARPLPEGCKLTAIFDSCHSATALDLPFVWVSLNKEYHDAHERDDMRFWSRHKQMLKKQTKGDKTSLLNPLVLAKAVTAHVQEELNHDSDIDKKMAELERRNTTKAFVVMFSGCRDDQLSLDTKLEGQVAGFMSVAFIRALDKYPYKRTYDGLLLAMRKFLVHECKNTKQVPQLSYGRRAQLDKEYFSL